jgi:hypothetical protein
MVWNALVIVTVLLPLAGLAIDVPRYFALRSRLQIAADTGAEAVARAAGWRCACRSCRPRRRVRWWS